MVSHIHSPAEESRLPIMGHVVDPSKKFIFFANVSDTLQGCAFLNAQDNPAYRNVVNELKSYTSRGGLALYLPEGHAILPNNLNINYDSLAWAVSTATGGLTDEIRARMFLLLNQVPEGERVVLFCSEGPDFIGMRNVFSIDNKTTLPDMFHQVNSKAILREKFSALMVPGSIAPIKNGKIEDKYRDEMISKAKGGGLMIRASHGVSGHGGKVIRSIDELESFLHNLSNILKFQRFPALLIEDLVSEDCILSSPSCQGTIHPDGSFTLIGAGQQTLNPEKQHIGNAHFTDLSHPFVQKMKELAGPIAKVYHENYGSEGLIGFDFLFVTENTFPDHHYKEAELDGIKGKLILVEANVRMTGAHPGIMTADILRKYHGDRVNTMGIWNGTFKFNDIQRSHANAVPQVFQHRIIEAMINNGWVPKFSEMGQNGYNKGFYVSALLPTGVQGTIVSNDASKTQDVTKMFAHWLNSITLQ